jgi:hypothetical protein
MFVLQIHIPFSVSIFALQTHTPHVGYDYIYWQYIKKKSIKKTKDKK